MKRVLAAGEFFGQSCNECRGDGVYITELVYSPDNFIPLHRHEKAFLCYVLKGELWIGIGETGRKYEQNALIYHPPGHQHENQVGNQEFSALILELGNHFLDRARDTFKLPERMASFSDPQLSSLMARIGLELRKQDAMSALAIEGLILETLAQMGRLRERTVASHPDWISGVLRIIHSGYRERITLDEIATEVAVHPTQISTTFRRTIGKTVGEFIRSLRVEYACQQLTGSEESLAEIAAASGFSDQSHMTRVFRQSLGVTPGEFR